MSWNNKEEICVLVTTMVLSETRCYTASNKMIVNVTLLRTWKQL